MGEFVCSSCGLRGLKHKAKGMCERCYGFAKRTAAKGEKSKVATDQQERKDVCGDDFLIDLGRLLDTDIVDEVTLRQVMQDFAKLARSRTRTPEAELYQAMCAVAYGQPGHGCQWGVERLRIEDIRSLQMGNKNKIKPE